MEPTKEELAAFHEAYDKQLQEFGGDIEFVEKLEDESQVEFFRNYTNGPKAQATPDARLRDVQKLGRMAGRRVIRMRDKIAVVVGRPQLFVGRSDTQFKGASDTICPVCCRRVWSGDLSKHKRVCPECGWEGGCMMPWPPPGLHLQYHADDGLYHALRPEEELIFSYYVRYLRHPLTWWQTRRQTWRRFWAGIRRWQARKW